jgi:sec-independent protein translocase protein TatC
MDDEKQGGVPPSGGDAPPQAHSPDAEATATTALVETRSAQPPALPPPPAPPVEPEDEDEGGMLRMSFMEHLEELRSRIIKALYGLVVAFVGSLIYAGQLWDIISDPAVEALKHLKVDPPMLAQLTPMESFSIIWVKLPLLCSVFIASPWIVYQVWAFISPGLYKKERRWALPFVLLTAGLFITGGLFAYFLAFRYGLEFLLGIGMSNNVRPVVSITEYFDLFVNVTLGVGLVFELPVIITPTPDVFNLMLFAIPMCALYFVGVFFSYLLILRREGRQFPWKKAIPIILIVLLVIAAIYAAIVYFHLHFVRHWPFLIK